MRHQHLIDLIFVLYRRDRLVAGEVVHILSGELFVLHLVAIGVNLLHLAHKLILGTLILSGGEAEVVCTLQFAHHGGISLLHLSVLGSAEGSERLLGA